MARRKKQPKFYVLFGFNKSDKYETGYFSNNNQITTELSCAKLFPSENVFNITGFGRPEKWMNFINTDKHLNKGYKFHLVAVNSHPKLKTS